ncbi:hypothetical protein ACWEJ6_49660 [Nonomuraea sp. NPDC004702]
MIVTHHPPAFDEASSARVGGDLEQARIRFRDALTPRRGVAMNRVGQAGSMEFAQVVVRHAIRDDP